MKKTSKPTKHAHLFWTCTGIISVFFTLIFLQSEETMCQAIAKSFANQSVIKTETDDGKGAYSTGKYRNLFLENGHIQKEILQKNEAAFQQLFHGDSATQAVYIESGRNEYGLLAYVSDVLHYDVRSEGISYSLIIAVQLNWSVDGSWWQKDQVEQEFSNQLQSFFSSQGMDAYGTQYTLDGQLLDKNHTKGLVATNAVESLSATHPMAKDFAEDLWKTPIPSALNDRY
jgi:hypothetical protein